MNIVVAEALSLPSSMDVVLSFLRTISMAGANALSVSAIYANITGTPVSVKVFVQVSDDDTNWLFIATGGTTTTDPGSAFPLFGANGITASGAFNATVARGAGGAGNLGFPISQDFVRLVVENGDTSSGTIRLIVNTSFV